MSTDFHELWLKIRNGAQTCKKKLLDATGKDAFASNYTENNCSGANVVVSFNFYVLITRPAYDTITRLI